MVLSLEGALLTSNHKLPSNLLSKDSLNMMDNILAMKILHCRPLLEHDQAVNAIKADRVFKGVMLLDCGQISKAEPSNAPTKYSCMSEQSRIRL